MASATKARRNPAAKADAATAGQTAIQRKIDRALKRRGRSRYWLGQECGFKSKCSVYKMLDSPATPVRTIQRFCRILGLKLVDPKAKGGTNGGGGA